MAVAKEEMIIMIKPRAPQKAGDCGNFCRRQLPKEGKMDVGETGLGPTTHHAWITSRSLVGAEVMLSSAPCHNIVRKEIVHQKES